MSHKQTVLQLLIKEYPWLENATDSFIQRKVLQKTVFILQEMGLPLGYGYNWYLHGPYSPALAEDAYELEVNKKHFEAEIGDYKFTAKKELKRFRELFCDHLTDELWLEIVSSLLFLKKYYGYNEAKDLEKHLLAKKPKLKRHLVTVDRAIVFVTKQL